MKKRILSIFMALTMGLTTVPATAWAADTGEFEFTIAEENAPEWIERVAMPNYAMDFYNMLIEASDGDGTADYLMDAKYFDLHKLVNSETFALTGPTKIGDSPIWIMDINKDKTECIIGLEAASLAVDDSEQDQVRNYITAAYSAFRSDHPEVFWLYRKIGFVDDVVNGEFVLCLELAQFEDTDQDGKWTLVSESRAEQFLLEGGDREGELYIDGEFIKKEHDVTDKNDIANWARTRAQEIINSFGYYMNGDNLPQNDTFKDYLRKNELVSEETDLNIGFNNLTNAGKIAYFDYWLTEFNGYNTIVAENKETTTSFGASTDAVSSRECISALVGKGEERGPVCVGFAAAMKVLCDTAGIGCVMVESIPGENHAWNYVQVDNGDWFGVDVTWNEGNSGAPYLLVNKDTMAEEHTVQNDGWGSIVFPDSPKIQEKLFAFAPGWLVDEGAAAERITEIKEVEIDDIVAPVLGETPVTTGFSVVTDNVSITKDDEGKEIPITWTDENGKEVEGAFAGNTVYKATFVIEPADKYTFGDTKVVIIDAPVGTKAEVRASNGTVTVTFPATQDDTPVFSPDGGRFRGSQNVAITALDGYEIYYTTDGTVPNADLTAEGNTTVKYDGEFVLTRTTTVKAIAVKDDLISEVKEAKFTKRSSSSSSVTDQKENTEKEPVEQKPAEQEPVETEPVAEEKTMVLTIGQQIVQVDGAYVMNDVAPIIRGERTVLPIRIIAESIGATVTWNEADQSVTIVKGDTTIVIYIGQTFALVNGDPVQLDISAFIENSRTYLPLRFVSENLGADVNWDQDTQQVTIAYK